MVCYPAIFWHRLMLHFLVLAGVLFHANAQAELALTNSLFAERVDKLLQAAGLQPKLSAPAVATAKPLVAQKQSLPSDSVLAPDPKVKGLIIRFVSQQAKLLSRANQPPPQALIDEIARLAQVKLGFARAMSMDAFVFRFELPLSWSDAQLVIDRIKTSNEVEQVNPDTDATHSMIPNDPNFSAQWNLRSTSTYAGSANLMPAWDLTRGSSATVVAVVDTGVRPHTDFFEHLLPGYDFITSTATANDGDGRDADANDPGDWNRAGECGGDSAAEDSSWHGTHVTGIIAASGDNATGIAGINWQTKILPVRVLGKCGGTVADIVDGMNWAAGLSVPGVPNNPNPAKIINMSLGGSAPYGCKNTLYQEAINQIKAQGVLVIVAAGNDNTEAATFVPASCDGVMTVGSVGPLGYRASYSNYSKQYKVDISAPGGDQRYRETDGILSTIDSGTTLPEYSAYSYKQGTSMAAPHVAGIASLAQAIDPNIAPALLELSLLYASRDFPASSLCTRDYPMCGVGIIDAARTLEAITALKPYSLVYEFYNVNTGHYFRTSSADEATGILRGSAGPGWIDTKDYFLTWRDASQGAVPVCRFYSVGSNSHFFTADAGECAWVKQNPDWQYEGTAYYVKLPVAGVCPTDTTPIYRAYNNRWMYNDSNHRFSTDRSEIDELVTSKQWLYEGIAMCVY